MFHARVVTTCGKKWARVMAAWLGLLLAGAAWAEPVKVLRVVDGDTFKFSRGDGRAVVGRLGDVDAPELGQRFGPWSALVFGEFLRGAVVDLRRLSVDRYGREVVAVAVDGRDLAAAMVERGAAWHYRAYSRRGELTGVEARAKKDRRGLWVESVPVAPWAYRAGARGLSGSK